MASKTVYQCLVEVFPRVDVRLLKAVAIEHSKDADTAVEVVLTEILPYLSNRSAISSRPCDVGRHPCSLSDEGAENDEPVSVLRHKWVHSEKTVGSISETRPAANDDASKTDLTCGAHHVNTTCQEQAPNLPIVLSSDANMKTNQLQGNIVREELILQGNSQHLKDEAHSGLTQTSEVISNTIMHEDNADQSQLYANNESEAAVSLGECQDIDNQIGHGQQTPQVTPTSFTQDNAGPSGCLTGPHDDGKACDDVVYDDFDMVIGGKSPQAESSSDDTGLEVENSVAHQTQDVAEGDLRSESPSFSIDDYEDVGSLHSSKIDLLEEMVEAAKDNKVVMQKILFAAMESVMKMMKQVELQERAAEQAKEEASRASLDILVKVEELKQMLARARETNGMHAGEVYGERAILATEARELQARLLSLSEERDKALAMLDGMHQALEARLAAAKELRKEAEQEKLEKEESARKELREQENIMEAVVKESLNLQKYAEDNSKLREFLMDRGCVIDTLQGEISVICQDGRLLKEKFFDERIPLSESVSSSQTTCILASSGISLKGMASDVVPELNLASSGPFLKGIVSDLVPEPGETSKSPKKIIPACSADGKSPKIRHDKERVMANGKELLSYDGWDLVED